MLNWTWIGAMKWMTIRKLFCQQYCVHGMRPKSPAISRIYLYNSEEQDQTYKSYRNNKAWRLSAMKSITFVLSVITTILAIYSVATDGFNLRPSKKLSDQELLDMCRKESPGIPLDACLHGISKGLGPFTCNKYDGFAGCWKNDWRYRNEQCKGCPRGDIWSYAHFWGGRCYCCKCWSPEMWSTKYIVTKF